jgi:hypothetical protein
MLVLCWIYYVCVCVSWIVSWELIFNWSIAFYNILLNFTFFTHDERHLLPTIHDTRWTRVELDRYQCFDKEVINSYPAVHTTCRTMILLFFLMFIFDYDKCSISISWMTRHFVFRNLTHATKRCVLGCRSDEANDPNSKIDRCCTRYF